MFNDPCRVNTLSEHSSGRTQSTWRLCSAFRQYGDHIAKPCNTVYGSFLQGGCSGRYNTWCCEVKMVEAAECGYNRCYSVVFAVPLSLLYICCIFVLVLLDTVLQIICQCRVRSKHSNGSSSTSRANSEMMPCKSSDSMASYGIDIASCQRLQAVQ